MADLSVLGWILCSALSLFALYSLAFGGASRNHASPEKRNELSETVTTSAGECRSEKHHGDADVIIVGAGVAGASLAHTLGKVGLIYKRFSLLLIRFPVACDYYYYY